MNPNRPIPKSGHADHCAVTTKSWIVHTVEEFIFWWIYLYNFVFSQSGSWIRTHDIRYK